MKRRLCIPPIVLCIFDQPITLLGQNSRYWEGNYQNGEERFLLHLIGCFSNIPWRSRRGLPSGSPFSRWSYYCLLGGWQWQSRLSIVIGNTWGTSSWLLRRFGQGYWLCIALFLALASWRAYAINNVRTNHTKRHTGVWGKVNWS